MVLLIFIPPHVVIHKEQK